MAGMSCRFPAALLVATLFLGVVISAISPAQRVLWGCDTATGLMNMIGKEDCNVYAPIRTTLKLAQ